MLELLKMLEVLAGAGPGPWALATIVETTGSSYRRPGARMVMNANGSRFGAISGGCLEEDLVHHLTAILTSGETRTLVYDTTAENDLIWGVGLGCHGRVTLLLEPVTSLPPVFLDVQAASVDRRVGSVLVHAFDADATPGSARPTRQAGTLARFSDDGSRWLGPGLSAPVIAELEASARHVLRTGRSLIGPLASAAAPTRIFAEFIPPQPTLLVFGAGDDAQPLVAQAKVLGWRVEVNDPRPAFATAERFPSADAVHVLSASSARDRIRVDRYTYAVIMTHHYVHDRPYLAALANRDLAYVGMLGPRKRTERIIEDLSAEGVTLSPAFKQVLHAPVGLDLGGDTPAAVGLSILAEIQATLHRRDGTPLRLRTRPIHDASQT